jgi:hypothetical protein
VTKNTKIPPKGDNRRMKGVTPKQLEATVWRPGHTPNPAGRPLGARNKLSEGFIRDLQDIWATHGASILQGMLVSEPAKLADLVARLIPREFQVSVEHTAGAIPAGDKQLLVELLRVIRDAVPADAETTPVLEDISEFLRARYAKVVNGAQDE